MINAAELMVQAAIVALPIRSQPHCKPLQASLSVKIEARPSDFITVLQGNVHRAETLVSNCVVCIWHAGLAVAASGMCLPAGRAAQELPLPSVRDALSQTTCSLHAGRVTGRGRLSTRWGCQCLMAAHCPLSLSVSAGGASAFSLSGCLPHSCTPGRHLAMLLSVFSCDAGGLFESYP